MASGNMQDPQSDEAELYCPSARAEMDQAVIFGVVGGTASAPSVSYLDSLLAATPDLLALAEPVHPTEVFRIGAPCARKGCQHYDGARCALIQRIVDEIPPGVAPVPPPCRLRPRCRWWHEEGIEACIRCPLIVTEQPNPTPEMAKAARPRPAQAGNTREVAGELRDR